MWFVQVFIRYFIFVVLASFFSISAIKWEFRPSNFLFGAIY